MRTKSRDAGVKMAQSGGVTKGMPTKGSDAIGKGSGLKTAWSDQTARPSALTNMAPSKKKFR